MSSSVARLVTSRFCRESKLMPVGVWKPEANLSFFPAAVAR